MKDFATKLKMLTDIIETIYDARCISCTDDGLNTSDYHVRKTKFNRQGISRFEKIFDYTFKYKYPKYVSRNYFDRYKTFKLALTWLKEFFDLGIDPSNSLPIGGPPLKLWGTRLYGCYMLLMNELFVGDGDGQDEPIDCDQLRSKLLSNILELLGLPIPKRIETPDKMKQQDIIKLSGFASSPPAEIVIDENFVINQKNHVLITNIIEREKFIFELYEAKKAIAINDKKSETEQKETLRRSFKYLYMKIPYYMLNLDYSQKQSLYEVLKHAESTYNKLIVVLEQEYKSFLEDTLAALTMLIEDEAVRNNYCTSK